MLEALIFVGEVNTKSQENGKHQFDVISMRLSGAPWGRMSFSDKFRVVEWPIEDGADEKVLNELQARVNSGLVDPVIDYPFASYDNEEHMIERSVKKANMEKLKLVSKK